MVVRTSEIKPLAKKIAYACLNCNTLNEAQLKGLTLKKPTRCNQCSEKELEMDPENSYFTDFQLVRLQELPEDLPAGQLPHYVEVTVMDDLVDRCRPGDRVLLTGIVRIEQEQSLQVRTSLFRLRMEGNNIEFDFLKYAYEAVYSLKLSHPEDFASLLAEYDYRLTHGSHPDIQLTAFLAQLSRMGAKQ